MKIQDDLGPEKLIQVYDPKTGMKGFLVIDNTWLGVAKGGLRMTPTVDLKEVFHLARAMTYKNALAGLPFGGGKSGIVGDPKILSKTEKLAMVRSFAAAIKEVSPTLYIAGPDVNVGEDDMEEFVKENGSLKSATGKPLEKGGLPHELGSTGFGVAEATAEVLDFLGENLKGKKIAIAGFGNVGTFAAKFLREKGAVIAAVSDSKITLYNSDGIDVPNVVKIKKRDKSLDRFADAEKLPPEKIFSAQVDILVPAALGDVITADNVDQVKAEVVVEAANLAVRADAEIEFFKRNVLVVPDILANAGGVISSYAEYRGLDEEKMFSIVKDKIKKNTKLVLQSSDKRKVTPREAALSIARSRLEKAKPH